MQCRKITDVRVSENDRLIHIERGREKEQSEQEKEKSLYVHIDVGREF